MTAPSTPIKVLLADDHRLFRDGLKLLLGSLPHVQVVAEVAELGSLSASVQAHQPDLVILDYHMPGGDAGALLAWLRQRYPALRIIMLTGAQSPLVLQQLVALAPHALLRKDQAGDEVLHAIQAVLQGAQGLFPADLGPATLDISARELQVLRLICAGNSNKQMGDILNLSPKTVDKHRENLMRKLDVNNVAALIKKAYAHGLIETSL